MQLQDLVNAVILKSTGKATVLAPSSAKYLKVLGIANFYLQAWSNEPDVDWNSLYDPKFSIGTVSATNSFDLDDSIRKISDTRGDDVRIQTSNGNYIHYQVVPADTLQRYSTGNYCAQVGRTLLFNRTFKTTDQEFGGTIYVPIYTYLDPLVNASDDVLVDDPNWLVTITSAEYVRNDIVRQNQYPNLINEANVSMQRMKDDNEAQINMPDMPWNPIGFGDPFGNGHYSGRGYDW